MPFRNPCPHSFSLGSIRAHAPAGPGIYGISNAREWIFIDQSQNVLQALLQHLEQTTTPLMRRGPTGFVFEDCYPQYQMARCEALLREYGPACNPRQRR